MTDDTNVWKAYEVPELDNCDKLEVFNIWA